ncbi:REP-associated tyrosine transposase [Kangiella sp. M94]
MANYRRAYENGATYFFTVNLQDRNSSLLTDNIHLLTKAIRTVRRSYPFQTDALVILPEHLHTVITLPDSQYDFSIIWRYIKGEFSRSIKPSQSEINVTQTRSERGIWQRRFWEHKIRGPKDYENHINYCYYNPVKHGYVSNVADWKYSTFHRDVAKGLFPKDWASNSNFEGSFGE